MNKKYMLRSKRGKWVIQRIEDRITVSEHPFVKKSDAEAAMWQLLLAANPTKQEEQNGQTFVEAFAEYAAWCLNQYEEHGRVSKTSMRRYDTEFRLRISKFVNPKVLLSNFKLQDMEAYLDQAHAAGACYKTLKKSVKDIKRFLRRMKIIGKNPCLDMLYFEIRSHHKIVPEDDNLLYAKEVHLIDDEKIKEMINLVFTDFKKDIDASNTFGIFCMLFFFGLRASELTGIKRDCIDFEKRLLHIRGTIRQHKFVNKTKNRGSKRAIEIRPEAAKFLEIWMDYIDGIKPDNVYLFPGKNGGPLCYKYVHTQVWKTYARVGLADITVRRDGHVVVHSSPLKGYPTKMFRHRLASHLISGMNSHNSLNQNQVKSMIGHDLFSTTAGIYGNKLISGNEKQRLALDNAVSEVTNSKMITDIINSKK